MAPLEEADRLPLHCALAWIYWPDEAFLYEVARFQYIGLANRRALFESLTGREAVNRVEDEEDAWLRLSKEIVAGAISAVGKRYSPKRQGNEDLMEQDDPGEENDPVEEDLIGLGVLDLTLEASLGNLKLRPKNYALSGSSWWRDVWVSKGKLLELFPAVPKTHPTGGRDNKRDSAKAAVRALGLNLSPERQLDPINAWLKARGYPTVSIKTVQRAVEDVKAEDKLSNS